jgi:hypothetical protein
MQDKPIAWIQKTHLLVEFFPCRVEATKRNMPRTLLIASASTTLRAILPREPDAECDCACK